MSYIPGPWSIHPSNPNIVCADLRVDPLDPKYSLWQFVATCKTKDDAQLIACAPELLENFKKAILLIEHIQETHGLVHEVTIRDGYKLITKAMGGNE